MQPVEQAQHTWIGFFDYLYGSDTGFLCIATMLPNDRDSFSQRFLEWPKQRDDVMELIERVHLTHNVYFGVNLLSKPKRIKENCIAQNLVWGDLDSCRPEKVIIPPQCVIESSPHRFQAVWRLSKKVNPLVAQDFAKRIAYTYAEDGADVSGWDLTQLLRVPGTYNHKYTHMNETPQVRLLMNLEDLIEVELFENLKVPEDIALENVTGIPMPDADELPRAETIIYHYKDALQPTSFGLYFSQEPNDDWSKAQWRLINLCLEVGMSAEEAFVVSTAAKCNKYARDGRPPIHLWREVLKAELQHKSIATIFAESKTLTMPQLLTAKEEDRCGTSIIADYKRWAATATDAVEEFHELSCAILLSGLMAGGIRIPTQQNHKGIVPNLWGLVLGDSTLTRKTTSMTMAMDFLFEIDRQLLVASDGSAEGLLTMLATRPKMVSIFQRDEVTGLFDAIRKKEYLASMPELFALLYDVPPFHTRLLRKETITLIEPIFIFFGGGIRDKTYDILDEGWFLSGFIPRFLVVSGETDLGRIRRTGPPIRENMSRRADLQSTFAALYQMYSQTEVAVSVGDQMMSLNRETKAVLTSSAWERFGVAEEAMLAAAHDSPHALSAIPTFQRMAFSMLKLASLLAAARQEPDDQSEIKVEESDIIEATFYIQKWGKHMVDLIKNGGQSRDEGKLRNVYRTIESYPGITRGILMQRHHLNARMMSDIQETLEQRMMVQISRSGKKVQFWPIGK